MTQGSVKMDQINFMFNCPPEEMLNMFWNLQKFDAMKMEQTQIKYESKEKIEKF
jgi:hypothetical protein